LLFFVIILGLILGIFLGIKIANKNNEKKMQDIATLNSQIEEKEEKLKNIEEQYNDGQQSLARLQNNVADYTAKKDKLIAENDVLEAKIEQLKLRATENEEAVLEKVRAEYEIKRAQLKVEHEEKLRKEIAELKETTDLAALKQEVADYKSQVAAINAEKAKVLKREQAEFENSLEFSQEDKEDVDLIKDIAKKLNRKQILSDILWTVYYQKPLQDLRARTFGKVSNKVTGIYKITNNENEIAYIGQAMDISKRWTEHVKDALGSPTDKFHKAMAKVGPEGFSYEILEECDSSELNRKEKYWIDFFDTTQFGYNTQNGG